MLKIKEYVKAESLEQAYELNQKKTNCVIGGMLWLKMVTRNVQKAIDLSGLGLDQIEENDEEFSIGAMVTLRQIELHEGLNTWSQGAVKESVTHIVGVQFRNLAQPLSDFFKMVLVESYEELGFITYGLEIGELKQEIYKSLSELPELEEHGRIKLGNREIPWLTAYHIILTGNTGSGKSEVAMMLMYLLKKQNVEVVYCDPKHDEKMKRFCDAYDIEYYSDQEEIARCVASLQKELILREGDLEKGGLSRAQFSIEKYLFFDELLAYSVVATGANYKIVSSAIASLVLAGRGKNLYVCLITQRADVGSKSILDGFTRDSIYTRIVMGQASTTAQEMVFGNEFAKVKNTHKEIGSGLIFRVGIDSRPQELFVPFIHKK